ncbi:MAG: DUF4364 family protein, partial [Oscillospiraceae bacterium]
EIASLLAEDVALTVRERVLDYADHLARREQNSSSHRATIEKLPVGYRLRCSVSDRNCEIFALEVLLPTMADAHDAKEIFLDDAEELVRINLECLTGGQL